MIKCQNCNIEIENNKKFCPNCGTKIVDKKLITAIQDFKNSDFMDHIPIIINTCINSILLWLGMALFTLFGSLIPFFVQFILNYFIMGMSYTTLIKKITDQKIVFQDMFRKGDNILNFILNRVIYFFLNLSVFAVFLIIFTLLMNLGSGFSGDPLTLVYNGILVGAPMLCVYIILLAFISFVFDFSVLIIFDRNLNCIDSITSSYQGIRDHFTPMGIYLTKASIFFLAVLFFPFLLGLIILLFYINFDFGSLSNNQIFYEYTEKIATSLQNNSFEDLIGIIGMFFSTITFFMTFIFLIIKPVYNYLITATYIKYYDVEQIYFNDK